MIIFLTSAPFIASIVEPVLSNSERLQGRHSVKFSLDFGGMFESFKNK